MAGRELIGRDAELTSLTAFARGAHDGPAVAFVAGEPGIGKTALWSAVLDAARATSVRVLTARPTAAEAASSYAALDDLVRPLADLLARVPELPRRALASALLLDDFETVEPRAVALGVIGVTAEAAPALLAIDDWQWLDDASASVLAFAARRLPPGVRLLATVRTGGFDATVATLVREQTAFASTLEPLTAETLRRVVAARTGTTLSLAAAQKLHRGARGNALAALELVRAADGPPAGVVDVQRLLAQRVARLSDSARDVVRAVAALAFPTAELAERAADRPGDAAAAAGGRRAACDGLDEALAAEVLERDGPRLRFAHPLLAAAVEERTAPAAWRALHRRLADLVDDPEERARHLAEATDGPDEAVAAALEAAAAHASRRGAPGIAAELAERAARLTPDGDPHGRARRAVVAADAYAANSDGEPALRILDQLADALPAGPERAAALHRIASLSRNPDDVARLEQARAEAGDDDRLHAQIELAFSDRALNRDGAAVAADHAGRALRRAERCGDPGLRAMALADLAMLRFIGGEGVQRDALAVAGRLERDAGERFPSDSPAGLLGLQLALAGDFDPARAVLGSELARAQRTGNADLEAGLHMAWTELEVRTGRYAEAAAHAGRMLELSLGSGISNYESSARWAHALADAHRGHVDATRAQAERALELVAEVDDRIFVVNVRRTLGFLELSLGDAPAAARWLEPLPAQALALGDQEPMIYQLHGDVVEAHVLTGDLDAAQRVLDELEQFRHPHPWVRGVALRCRAQIRGAEGDNEAAIADLGAALATLERSGQPLEPARTLLALGVTYRRGKQRGAARQALAAARDRCAALGAVLWAARAEAEIARLGGRRAADRDELTETERRIAELAAEGRLNRDIAATLFVSERTVEANLTRAYRKLGVRSRTELARRLPAE